MNWKTLGNTNEKCWECESLSKIYGGDLGRGDKEMPMD